MPELNEIRKAREVGYGGHHWYKWTTCEGCGKEKWKRLKDGKPVRKLCLSCARKLLCRSPEIRLQMSLAQKGKRVGAKNPLWKGGKHATPEGYINIWISPDDFFYPMANHQHYVREHRLVMAKRLGRCLQPWEIVHHKGIRHSGIENKSDNLIDNLELTGNINEHSLAHSKGYKDGYLKGLHDGRLKQIQELKEEIEELRRQ